MAIRFTGALACEEVSFHVAFKNDLPARQNSLATRVYMLLLMHVLWTSFHVTCLRELMHLSIGRNCGTALKPPAVTESCRLFAASGGATPGHPQFVELSKCVRRHRVPALTTLTALQTLNLSRCRQLRELPPLDNLTALHTLNLGSCGLLQQLSLLSTLTTLQNLDLRCCRQIQELPPIDSLTAVHTQELCFLHGAPCCLLRFARCVAAPLAGCHTHSRAERLGAPVSPSTPCCSHSTADPGSEQLQHAAECANLRKPHCPQDTQVERLCACAAVATLDKPDSIADPSLP
jgi:hypothetical protein